MSFWFCEAFLYVIGTHVPAKIDEYSGKFWTPSDPLPLVRFLGKILQNFQNIMTKILVGWASNLQCGGMVVVNQVFTENKQMWNKLLGWRKKYLDE